MEILGIGPMELILILIVALMVFGPDRLPQIGAKLGRAMRDMRRATRAISEEINSTRAAIEAPAKELAEPFKEVTDAAKAAASLAAAARNPGQAIRESVLRELNAPLEPESSAAKMNEEHGITPPQPGEPDQERATAEVAGGTAEPVPSLPAPDEPAAALPPPDEPIAALPTLEDTSVASTPGPSPSEGEDSEGEDSEPAAAPDSLPPTPPEQ